METKRDLTKYMRPAAGVLLLGTVALSLLGCVKRELEVRPDEGYVEIALDWGGDTRPQSARYLIYNEDGSLVKEVSGVTDCFKGTLPTGNYRVVVHNTDAQQVDWRGTERYETAEVYARETNYSEGHHPAAGVPCVLEPQVVFGTGRCNEDDGFEVIQLDTVRLSVTPAELTKTVKLHFTVESSQAVSSLSGILSGVAQGVFLADGRCNASSPCAVEYRAEAAAGGTTFRAAGAAYEAQVGIFDLVTTAQSPAGTNTLHVRLSLDDGSQISGTFDITGTLKQLIAGSGGSLPDDIPVSVTLHVQGTDLEATVEPWDESGTGSGDPRPQA